MSEEVEEKLEEAPAKGNAQELAEALCQLHAGDDKDYVEILSSTDAPTQCKLRLRVFNKAAWVHFLQLVFKEELRSGEKGGRSPWSLHICRQYMYDPKTKKLKFFWNFIVSSEDVAAAVADLCRLTDVYILSLDNAPPPLPAPQPVHVPAHPSPAVGAAMATHRRPQKPAIIEEDLFSDMKERIEIDQGGEVVTMPLLGSADRNRPEGGLFEKGRSPKGVHQTSGR